MPISLTDNAEKVNQVLNQIMEMYLDTVSEINHDQGRKLFSYNMVRDLDALIDAASAIIVSNRNKAFEELKQGTLFDD